MTATSRQASNARQMANYDPRALHVLAYAHGFTLWHYRLSGPLIEAAGYENHQVGELAEIVAQAVGNGVEIVTTPSDDHRSYHVSSARIERELDFRPTRTIEDAVLSLTHAFDDGLVPDPMTDPRYYNVKRMQAIVMR